MMPDFGDSEHGRWQPTDISPSRLKVWNLCPMKYKYQYVDKLRLPPNYKMEQGSSVHSVFLEEYLQGGVDDIDALVALIGMDLEARIESSKAVDPSTGEYPTDSVLAQAIADTEIWGKGLLEAAKNGVDPRGNAFEMHDVEKTEGEECVELTLPRTGITIRLRGYVDLYFKDGAIGDLKLASNYYKAVWSEGRAIGEEVQPAMYAKMTGSNTFRYLIVDKCINSRAPGRPAAAPTVRWIEIEITDRDMQILMDNLEEFVIMSDIHNGHEDGIFTPRPKYAGESKRTAGNSALTFCDHFCDHKARCYKENFERPPVKGIQLPLED